MGTQEGSQIPQILLYVRELLNFFHAGCRKNIYNPRKNPQV